MDRTAPWADSMTKAMQELNFPHYDFRLRGHGGRGTIFDAIRRRWVSLTPEEWVRQHVIAHLTVAKGVPQGLIAIEKAFLYQGMQRRADVVAYGRNGQPLLMVECKAPDVDINQDAFDQVAGYNRVMNAPFLMVTNGLVHYVCSIDRAQHQYAFLNALPTYREMIADLNNREQAQ